MRFIGWNLLFAAWLLVSAFVLPHTAFSQLTTWVVAIFFTAAALLAADKPGARFAISALAVALAVIALLMPGMSAAAVVNNLIVAAILFALSLVNPSSAPAMNSKRSA